MTIDILKAFQIDKLPYWMAFIVISILLLVFGLIIAIPKIIENNIKNSKDSINNRNLQVESYFRKISGNEIKTLFETWASLLLKMPEDKDELADTFNYLIEKTTMYGSPRTIRLLAMYQQENYLNQGEVDTPLSMAYIAEIISSLKYDFSGYKVDPLSLVSIKINDIKKHEVKFNNNVKKIEKNLQQKENKRLETFKSIMVSKGTVILLIVVIIYLLFR